MNQIERRMDIEAGPPTWESRIKSYRTTLLLAYQSFGVVYGDLSTSPIYVYTSTFSGRLRLYEEDHEILGVLSLVFWTLTIIPLCKYIIFVLAADDNGEGGTFALYSLLCRYSKMGLLKSSHVVPDYKSYHDPDISSKETRTSLLIKGFFEKNRSSRMVLLFVVLLGTSMVIGDGILTPTMSVLSAVYGIETKFTNLHQNYTILIACIILVGLFALQHYGTHRVGFLFAPIMIAWLLCISAVGIYNIVHWNPSVIHALSPYYVYNFFKEAGKHGWSALGGIVLCLTGAEAMYADLGHFSQSSIRIAFVGLVYPCLVLAYMGEAAYLSKNKADIHSSFYKAIPEAIFWPVFIIATLATIVGSQAIISATFSIISQCRALSCFPRVKIIHTSRKIHGQIYIPEVNWILMILCLAVVLGFRDTNRIGNAYGLAVITMMFVTTCLMFLIITTVWKRKVLLAILFVVIFGSLELLYFSACLAKVHKGGWLPLLFSTVILILMSVWHYGTMKKHNFELQNKVCLDSLISLGPSLGITRVPGIGLIYTDVAHGLPPMFAHFVANFPAFHQVLIFVTYQSVMVPKVPATERFIVTRIGPHEFCLFRCMVRYGYKEVKDSYNFETQLLEKLSEFLKSEYQMEVLPSVEHPQVQETDAAPTSTDACRRSSRCKWKQPSRILESQEEVMQLMEATEFGTAYMIGNTYVVANDSSSFLKKLAIDFLYSFLRRNCRRPAVDLGVPFASLVEVGMVYHV